MNLAGQTAIVTGGSRGIGRAICKALAKQGARVGFCHADDPKAVDTLAEIRALSEGFSFACDVSSETEVAAYFASSEQTLGMPTILVNNAGILKESPLTKTAVLDFDRVIAVNLRGAFLASRAFVRSSKSGRIIFVFSTVVASSFFLYSLFSSVVSLLFLQHVLSFSPRATFLSFPYLQTD